MVFLQLGCDENVYLDSVEDDFDRFRTRFPYIKSVSEFVRSFDKFTDRFDSVVHGCIIGIRDVYNMAPN